MVSCHENPPLLEFLPRVPPPRKRAGSLGLPHPRVSFGIAKFHLAMSRWPRPSSHPGQLHHLAGFGGSAQHSKQCHDYYRKVRTALGEVSGQSLAVVIESAQAAA